MKIERFLIISAGGETRVVNRMPALRLDEFCYRLTVEIPAGWGAPPGPRNDPSNTWRNWP